MSRIFKQGSLEDELLQRMESAQVEAVKKEESRQGDLIIQAMENLNAAAGSLERAGKTERVKEVSRLMMALAEGKKPKKEKKVSSKDEAKKVFMFFGFKPEDLGSDFSDEGSDGGDGE